jgi:hypothetical protein
MGCRQTHYTGSQDSHSFWFAFFEGFKKERIDDVEAAPIGNTYPSTAMTIVVVKGFVIRNGLLL